MNHFNGDLLAFRVKIVSNKQGTNGHSHLFVDQLYTLTPPSAVSRDACGEVINSYSHHIVTTEHTYRRALYGTLPAARRTLHREMAVNSSSVSKWHS